MSLDPILWAMKDAPTADIEEWGVLTFLAEKADEDGCSALPSATTIARYTKLNRRTIVRRLDELERRGVIQRGDQNAAAYLPDHRQPTVYDLQVPCSWFPNIERTNEFRAQRGRPSITPQTRPDLPPAPEPKPRSDKGKSKATRQPGDSQSSHDSQTPHDSQTRKGVTHRHQGGDSQTPNPPHKPSPINPPPFAASTATKHTPSAPTPNSAGEGDTTLTPGSTADSEPTRAPANEAGVNRGHLEAARELLASLPHPWTPGRRALADLAPDIAAALEDGWDSDHLTSHLTDTRGLAGPVRSPIRLLASRVATLPAPQPQQPNNPESTRQPGDTACDEIRRQRTAARDPNAEYHRARAAHFGPPRELGARTTDSQHTTPDLGPSRRGEYEPQPDETNEAYRARISHELWRINTEAAA